MDWTLADPGNGVQSRRVPDLPAPGHHGVVVLPPARARRDAAGGGGQLPAARPGGRLDDAGVLHVPVLPARRRATDRRAVAERSGGLLRGAELRRHAATAAVLLRAGTAGAGAGGLEPGLADPLRRGLEYRAQRRPPRAAGFLPALPRGRAVPRRDRARLRGVAALRAHTAGR